MRKFAASFLISCAVAIATPALSAGLVVGMAGTVKVVADAGPLSHSATAETDVQAVDADVAVTQPRVATGGPRRLGPLGGTDELAWSSAHEVHVRSASRKH